LDKVGYGLAVLLSDQADVLAGQCVAIIDCSGGQNWTVETVLRKRLIVVPSQLGVIFSESHADIVDFR
jgi:hypothetical protein